MLQRRRVVFSSLLVICITLAFLNILLKRTISAYARLKKMSIVALWNGTKVHFWDIGKFQSPSTDSC